ncbi:MAG TPA: glutathione S-transferase [Burkholderiales bacterium]|nr:glutathione S-transferase [Burkholderiales bacterium]
MKLVGTPLSPFTRKARIVAIEKRIDFEFVVDRPNEPDTRVPEHNPIGKVPVLIMDDGTTLFDSRVIVDYLDSITPLNRLIPEPNRQRIYVKRWEALADGMTDAAVLIVYEGRRSKGQQSADWVARQRSRIDRALAAMAEDLGTQSWCTGDAFNLSDIAVGCALGFIDLRLEGIDWRKQYPNLAKLSGKLEQRNSFKETAAPAA